MKRTLLTTTLILLLVLLPYSRYIKANGSEAPQTSIGVSPAILEVIADPNSPVKQEVSILNLTDTAIPIRTTKESFSLEEKSDIPTDKLEMYDASSWINISEDETDFILQPKEIKKITFEIKQPENSSPGGHYATVFFQGLTREDQISDNSANINIKIGVLVLIQVQGDIKSEIKIKKFSAADISNTPQLTFNLELENTGNVHLLPSGKVNFYNEITNELIKSESIGNKLILPGLVNSYSFDVDTNSMIGRVSAQVVLNYGARNTELKSEKIYVSIFPYILILALIILSILIIIFRNRVLKAMHVFITYRNSPNKAPEAT